MNEWMNEGILIEILPELQVKYWIHYNMDNLETSNPEKVVFWKEQRLE